MPTRVQLGVRAAGRRSRGWARAARPRRWPARRSASARRSRGSWTWWSRATQARRGHAPALRRRRPRASSARRRPATRIGIAELADAAASRRCSGRRSGRPPSACTMRTRVQSAPSSSASEHGQRAAHALAHLRAAGRRWSRCRRRRCARTRWGSASGRPPPRGRGHERRTPSARPPHGAAERGHERPRGVISIAAHGFVPLGRRGWIAAADARVGAAAAEVAAIDWSISASLGFGLRGQQRGRGHDLPRLAEPALRHGQLDPGLLQRVIAVGDRPSMVVTALPAARRQRRHAGAHRLAVEVHGAGAAQRLAAAVLGAGEPEQVAQRPQERHLGIGVELVLGAVDAQR